MATIRIPIAMTDILIVFGSEKQAEKSTRDVLSQLREKKETEARNKLASQLRGGDVA